MIHVSKEMNITAFGGKLTSRVVNTADGQEKAIQIIPYSQELELEDIRLGAFLDKTETAIAEPFILGLKEDGVNLTHIGLRTLTAEDEMNSSVIEDISLADIKFATFPMKHDSEEWVERIIYPLYKRTGDYAQFPKFMEKASDLKSLTVEQKEIAISVVLNYINIYCKNARTSDAVGANSSTQAHLKAGYLPLFSRFQSDSLSIIKSIIIDSLKEIKLTANIKGKQVEMRNLVLEEVGQVWVSIYLIEAIMGKVEGFPKLSDSFLSYLKGVLEDALCSGQ